MVEEGKVCVLDAKLGQVIFHVADDDGWVGGAVCLVAEASRDLRSQGILGQYIEPTPNIGGMIQVKGSTPKTGIPGRSYTELNV